MINRVKMTRFEGYYFIVPNYTKFISKDKDGSIWAYKNKPVAKDGHWISSTKNDLSFKRIGTISHLKSQDWEQSLAEVV